MGCKKGEQNVSHCFTKFHVSWQDWLPRIWMPAHSHETPQILFQIQLIRMKMGFHRLIVTLHCQGEQHKAAVMEAVEESGIEWVVLQSFFLPFTSPFDNLKTVLSSTTSSPSEWSKWSGRLCHRAWSLIICENFSSTKWKNLDLHYSSSLHH